MRAVCARCERASASGPAPTSAVSARWICRSEYPSRRRQSRHALAIDHAVADQAQCAADEVAADVPLGRAGRGVRTAPLARAVAGPLGRRGAGVEADVAGLGRDRRAGRPAVDAGGAHRGEEPAVEAAVAALHRAVANIELGKDHAPIVPRGSDNDWRFSDITIRLVLASLQGVLRRVALQRGQEGQPVLRRPAATPLMVSSRARRNSGLTADSSARTRRSNSTCRYEIGSR